MRADEAIVEEVFSLTAQLVEYRSITGEEREVADFIVSWMQERDWPVERLGVDEERYNVFCSFGTPEILLSTHIDVVPAPDHCFTPKIREGALFGRGACDAKGCVATMLLLAEELRAHDISGFGLLFVVGEEHDGIGAQTAAAHLLGRGVKAVINGEPTDGRFASASKGVLDFEIEFSGRACHSGYPVYGEDANLALVQCAQRLLSAHYGYDSTLGYGIINLGKLSGGLAANVISPHAKLSCCLRTVHKNNEREKELIKQLAAPAQAVFLLDAPSMKFSVPEWEEQPCVAAFVTDLPHFAILDCELYLCGPGSILTAHTEEERLRADEVVFGYRQYRRLFETLRA